MTDLRQAAQQALEALENMCDAQSNPDRRSFPTIHDFGKSRLACIAIKEALEQQAEPVSMRMPKVGDKVICLEDESLGKVVSLTAGGSPDITFDDGTRGTYLLREFAELFGYAEQRQQQADPVAWMYQHEETGRTAFIEMSEHKDGWKPSSSRMKLIGPLYTTPPAPSKREWVGLTDEEVAIASAEFDTRLKLAFHAGMYKAQIILRKKNDSTY